MKNDLMRLLARLDDLEEEVVAILDVKRATLTDRADIFLALDNLLDNVITDMGVIAFLVGTLVNEEMEDTPWQA